MIDRIVAIVRSLFIKTPVAPAPVAPAPIGEAFEVTRTIGGQIRFQREVVGHRMDTARETVAALQMRGKVYDGEAVDVDGVRWRVNAGAAPTPIDPAKRSRSGDRRRDRERRAVDLGLLG